MEVETGTDPRGTVTKTVTKGWDDLPWQPPIPQGDGPRSIGGQVYGDADDPGAAVRQVFDVEVRTEPATGARTHTLIGERHEAYRR